MKKRKATEQELNLTKRLRALASRCKNAKDAEIMQEMYFDISDHGVDMESLFTIRRLMRCYGNRRDTELVKNLIHEKPIEQRTRFVNIYSAVGYLYGVQKIDDGKKMTEKQVRDVLEHVCRELGIDVKMVTSKLKYKEIVKCRMITSHLVSGKASQNVIAKVLNLKNRSTICHQVQEIDRRLATDENFQKEYNNIKAPIML